MMFDNQFKMPRDPVQLAGILSLLGIVAWIGLAIRRLFFHPLSKYPGPWYHSVSEVPIVVAILSGRLFAYYTNLHRKYGPVVRVAPNELSFVTETALEDIFGLGTKQGVPPTEKDERFHIGVKEKPYGLIDAPRSEHGRLRRALGSIFNSSALLNQEPIVQARVDDLVSAFAQEIDERGGGATAADVDMNRWAQWFAFDVVGSLVFGRPFGCVRSRGAENAECAEALSKTITMGSYEQAACRLLGTGRLGRLLRPALVYVLAPSRFYRGRLGALVQIMTSVKSRLQEDDREDLKDIVYHVRKKNDYRNLLDEGEVERNVRDFILAGGETIGAALTSWAYCMSNPENIGAATHLRDLIRSSFASKEEITWTKLRSIPYLDGVIKESLRMILTSVNRLRVVPPGGMHIDGHFIPGGMTVTVSEYPANHLESNFHDPYTFKPERWLDPDTKDSLGVSKPFSYGPRDCVGKNLADMEMKLYIAHLVWHFDMTTGEIEGAGRRKAKNWKWTKKNDWENINVFAGPESPPLWVEVKRRGD